MKYSICFSILFTIPYLSNTVVFAACSSTSPSAGTTVTCTGSSSIPININSANNVTLNIDSGADITTNTLPETVKINISNNVVVNNNGTLSNSIGPTNVFSITNSDNAIITNNGTISMTGDIAQESIDAVGSDIRLINNGLINHSTGDNTAIITFYSDRGYFYNQGTISGVYNNSLSIVNTYDGIALVGDDAEFNNNGNITIINDEGSGIMFTGENSMLINSGVISVSDYTANPGFEAARYAIWSNPILTGLRTIINSSTGLISIDGDSVAIFGEEAAENLVNEGQIQGHIVLGEGNDSFINNGTIRNGSVDLGLGSDIMTVFNNASFENITTLNGGDDALSADGDVDILTFDGWNGILPQADNWETINFSNNALVNLGASRTITTEQFSINSTATVSAIGNSPGVFVVAGNVTNNGVLTLADTEANDTFTVGGNYSGSGRVVLDTVLGSDNSSSDQLIINGNATGNTTLVINNVGGIGAETTGDGILVIQVDGVSSTNSFQLLNDSISAGAYEYSLFFQNLTGTNQNWYLRSTRLRREAGIYKSIPAVMSRYMWDNIGRYHERESNRPISGDTNALSPQFGWVRVYRNDYKFNFDNDNNFDADWSGLQGGLDFYRSNRFEGVQSVRTGVFIGSAIIDENVDDIDKQKLGEVDMTSHSVGLYATLLGEDSWYLDGIIQLSKYEVDTESVNGVKGNTDGYGFASSIEFGLPLQMLEDNSISFEPQLQLAYQQMHFDKFDDKRNGTKFSEVDIKNQNRILLRAGGRLEKLVNYDAENTKYIKPYIDLNYYKEWGDHFDVTLDDVKTSLNSSDDWFGAGLGFIGKLNASSEFNFSVTWEEDLDGESHRGIKSEFGFRLLW